ncbi:MAG: FAD binding domain-containing protein [Terriglobia bacterium]
MERFEYASPDTLKSAVSLLGNEWGRCEVMAGGTDLVSAMKDSAVTPKRVVSITRVAGLRGVRSGKGGSLRIGSTTSVRELLANPHVKQHYPGVIQAAEGIRSEQLRNMGTVGGELLQRPRCWYFRLGYGLMAEYQGKSMPREGDNRYHAILGNSGACFVSPSSLAPVLIALGSSVELYGPGGTREIPLAKLYTTPTQAGEREHTLHPNEILTEIIVPGGAGAHSATYEVRQKEAMDWPLAAAAVTLRMEGGTVRQARVVLGHVAPIPWPSPEANRALEGKIVSEETADAAGKAAVAGATPLSMNGYKVQLARVAVKRAILRAAQSPTGGA